jgi:hypothetical protein
MSDAIYRPIARLLGQEPANVWPIANAFVANLTEADENLPLDIAFKAAMELAVGQHRYDIDAEILYPAISQTCWNRAASLAHTAHSKAYFDEQTPLIDRLLACALMLDDSPNPPRQETLWAELKKINELAITRAQDTPKWDNKL